MLSSSVLPSHRNRLCHLESLLCAWCSSERPPVYLNVHVFPGLKVTSAETHRPPIRLFSFCGWSISGYLGKLTGRVSGFLPAESSRVYCEHRHAPWSCCFSPKHYFYLFTTFLLLCYITLHDFIDGHWYYQRAAWLPSTTLLAAALNHYPLFVNDQRLIDFYISWYVPSRQRVSP